MAKIIIVTGKTGTGKTHALKALGFSPTIYLDDYIKNNFYIEGHPVFKQLIFKFGEDIVIDGKIDSNLLGKKVFDQDRDMNIALLNHLNFPYIKQLLSRLKNNYVDDYVIVEMAIYAEHERHFQQFVDHVVYLQDGVVELEEKFKYLNKKPNLITSSIPNYDTLVTREDIVEELKKIIAV